jgi:hypothetical protein
MTLPDDDDAPKPELLLPEPPRVSEEVRLMK